MPSLVLGCGHALHVDQIELFPAGAFGIAYPTHLGALGTMVISALVTLLYVFRRRLYILQWVVAWASLTGSLTLSGRDHGTAVLDALGFGLARALSLMAIAAIALSATTFQERRWPGRRYLLLFIPVLTWCVLSPLLSLIHI